MVGGQGDTCLNRSTVWCTEKRMLTQEDVSRYRVIPRMKKLRVESGESCEGIESVVNDGGGDEV